MTTPPPSHTTVDRRRVLTTGGLAALGGLAAATLGPGAAQASNGQPVVIGTSNDGSAVTMLDAPLNGAATAYISNFGGQSSDAGLPTRAVEAVGSDVGLLGIGGGTAGVVGILPRGTNYSPLPAAVLGLAAFGFDGVRGVSDTGTGVHGEVPAGARYGVHGNCQEATGVGVFGDGAYAATGVYGHSGSGVGVKGVVNEGVAVLALALGAGGASGTGLHASHGAGGLALLADSAGDAVHATTAAGTAVLATATATAGYALRVSGRASFSGTTQFSRSGTLTVGGGTRTATKSGVVVRAGTLVLATIQQASGTTAVASAVPDPAGSSFTVTLSAAAPAGGLKVAWLLVN